MASSCCFLLLLSLFPLLFPFVSSSTSTSTIPLSLFNTNPSQDLYEKLTHLASISLARANYIKKSQDSSVSTTPLYPHSYGGYCITLGFGTPPQKIPFIMDTGSNFVWFPCTTKYLCKNCPVSSSSSQSIPTFIPKSSSTARVVGCLNPKCGWIHTKTNPKSRCQDCRSPTGANCKQICPPYIILYGSGSTGGLALVETLDMSSNKKIPNFLVGCSMFSSQQPAGIAGLGRGLTSLPSQLGVKKFSYCLVSHRFDDTGKSSNLVLDFKAEKSANLSYTPLLKNPVVAGKNALSVYYYVGLRKITVGGQKVKIPYKYLTPDSNGNGGSIVDSGTTFTYMNRGVFEPLLNAFVNQVKGISRTEGIEKLTGLRPCFNISSHKTVFLPELKFHFKGGLEMALPLANYFSIAGENDVICLTMITDSVLGPELSTGPSIILGNFQMQNFFVEFDLRNEKLGFRHQVCN
ncbi:putative aspartyl protease At4g16563 [Nicotiana tabacum]|uniref:Aspartic proteinase nepenthesin-2-like n=2 Tax=Nicotiana TaxID=4085 RepID=A0A1S3YSS7_TOBAC|nr:PREDICTED: aspartic proteinase nepenthesin-2-like [Nicotiana sylvestris]XP_016455286.1 PREDICTED: aspartic proteinase nepenthesin-2-like [Nicotiana tabacum]